MGWLRQGVHALGEAAAEHLPMSVTGTAAIRLFGLAKIPMIAWIGPSVVQLDDDRCVIRVPLNWRTKNHLRVMYLGCMVAGADLAGGVMAMRCIRAADCQIDLLFKNMKADFLRRADGDAHFICESGAAVAAAVQEAVQTGQRVNIPLPIHVTVPSQSPDRVVAEFEMTLTLKRR